MKILLFIKKFLPQLVLFLVWFFLRGKLGSETVDTVDTYFVLGLFAYFLGKSYFSKWKYDTESFIVENMHFSTNGKFFRAGQLLVARMGDISSNFVNIHGSDGIVLLPLSSINKIGNNFMSRVRVERVLFEQLDPISRSVITTHGLSKDKLFMGWNPSKSEFKDKSKYEDFIEYKDNNTLLTRKDAVLKNDFDQVEKTVSHSQRVHDRASGGGIFGMLRPRKKKKDEEIEE